MQSLHRRAVNGGGSGVCGRNGRSARARLRRVLGGRGRRLRGHWQEDVMALLWSGGWATAQAGRPRLVHAYPPRRGLCWRFFLIAGRLRTSPPPHPAPGPFRMVGPDAGLWPHTCRARGGGVLHLVVPVLHRVARRGPHRALPWKGCCGLRPVLKPRRRRSTTIRPSHPMGLLPASAATRPR